MKGLVWVAPIDVALRCLREACLQGQDGLCVRRGLLCRLARELQRPADVGEVLLPQGGRLFIRLGVVVAVRKPEASLQGRGDHLRGVLAILLGAELKEHVGAHRLQAEDLRAQSREIGNRGDLRQLRLDRRKALRFDGRLVHAGAVEVAELALLRARRRRFIRRQDLEDLVQIVLVALPQLVEGAPPRPVRRDGIPGQPSPVAVQVEVGAGLDRRVHGGHVEGPNGCRGCSC